MKKVCVCVRVCVSWTRSEPPLSFPRYGILAGKLFKAGGQEIMRSWLAEETCLALGKHAVWFGLLCFLSQLSSSRLTSLDLLPGLGRWLNMSGTYGKTHFVVRRGPAACPDLSMPRLVFVG